MIQLTLAGVRYKTYYNKTRTGVCSKYLSELKPYNPNHPNSPDSRDAKSGNEWVYIGLKKGSFAIPAPDVPTVLVGPGNPNNPDHPDDPANPANPWCVICV